MATANGADATRFLVGSVWVDMRCIAKFVGAALVLIAATACGGSGPTGPQPTADKPAGSSAPTPPSSGSQPLQPPKPSQPPLIPPGQPRQVVPEGSTVVAASQIDGSSLPEGYPREVYTSNGGTVLSIKAQEGGCGRAGAAPAQESAKQVVVILTETQAQTDQLCTMDIRYPVVTVPLGAPLGERVVVLKYERR
jgi:hypothetical protein